MPDLQQRRRQSSEYSSIESDLDLARFAQGARRNSMLASLRVLNGTNGASARFESRRRGSLAAGRRRSDPLAGADGAKGRGIGAGSRRGSLLAKTFPVDDALDGKHRSKKHFSVPGIIEEGVPSTLDIRSHSAVRPRTGPRSPSHGRRPSPNFLKDGLERVSFQGSDGRGAFLATGGTTVNSLRTRLQQARIARQKRLLQKFKSYARLITFLHRLCKSHFLSVDNTGASHRGKYIEDGGEQELLFDVRYFRAHKEAGISTDCKKILNLPFYQRTEKDRYHALIALRNFPTFAEFPLGMQQEIVKVGWYEKYQAQRVILRQGHRPLNFYFILSGSVVVRVMEEGSDVQRTVVYLNRGETFGELGLVNKQTRKSTVISRDRVEFLCIDDVVSSNSYTRIFMAGGVATLLDPTQSDFVRNLKFLEGWPMHLLAENPKKCIFSYFKRGDVLVKNSKKSDWILIVKSGSCSVMKLLHKKKPKEMKRLQSDTMVPDLTTIGKRHSMRGGSLENYNQRKTRDEFELFMQGLNVHERDATNGKRKSLSENVTQNREDGGAQGKSKVESAKDKRNARRLSRRPTLPSQHSNVHMIRRPSLQVPNNSDESDESPTEDTEQLNIVQVPMGQKKTVATEIVDEIIRNEEDGVEPVWVKVQTLTKGSYFGLSDMLFDFQPSFSVVSNGAECILISKKFYREHATTRMLGRLRREEQSYPDDQELQKNLEVKLEWDAYKKSALLTTLKRTRKKNNQPR
ncbi:uncharacterized protein LOC117305239 [Asterias rubens]|uniref:uncharacterized protein LOC117305239 n=1 Tax=Asterias rubens TaxID=7604 RepID=UPI001455BEAE|nr:uncharacterized protein LOC117305239 [Asterias rubens]